MAKTYKSEAFAALHESMSAQPNAHRLRSSAASICLSFFESDGIALSLEEDLRTQAAPPRTFTNPGFEAQWNIMQSSALCSIDPQHPTYSRASQIDSELSTHA